MRCYSPPSLADLRARGPPGPVPDVSLLPVLQVLETLYAALEELYYPFPPGFHTKLAALAFYALPRPCVAAWSGRGGPTRLMADRGGALRVIMQYVDRGVLRLTAALLDQLGLARSASEGERHFHARLLAHVRAKVRALSPRPCTA
jgi:hypothetical protein